MSSDFRFWASDEGKEEILIATNATQIEEGHRSAGRQGMLVEHWKLVAHRMLSNLAEIKLDGCLVAFFSCRARRSANHTTLACWDDGGRARV